MKLKNVLIFGLFSLIALSCASVDTKRQPSSETKEASQQEYIEKVLERIQARR